MIVSSAAQPVSFSTLFNNAVGAAMGRAPGLETGVCASDRGIQCRLCRASAILYDREFAAKEQAFGQFWTAQRLGGTVAPLVPSPRGRGYRTVSKRRVFTTRNGISLALLAPDSSGVKRPLQVDRCAIEAPLHAEVFRHSQRILSHPASAPLSARLQYVIVKGTYDECSVILNVSRLDGTLGKAVNLFSKHLTRAVPQVSGLAAFEGEEGSGYYQDAGETGREPVVRKIHGRDAVRQVVRGKVFHFPPLAFSQVNLSMAERMVETAAGLLGSSPAGRLYDLYCGYGLFGICLAGSFRDVVGVEVSASSIGAARQNAEKNRVSSARFHRSAIDEENIERLMQGAGTRDAAVVDPPRGGTAPGVIEEIAAHGLGRILHFFCNIDIIGRELQRWADNGYTPGQVIPFDMFPGTSDLEVLVVLRPATP